MLGTKSKYKSDWSPERLTKMKHVLWLASSCAPNQVIPCSSDLVKVEGCQQAGAWKEAIIKPHQVLVKTLATWKFILTNNELVRDIMYYTRCGGRLSTRTLTFPLGEDCNGPRFWHPLRRSKVPMGLGARHVLACRSRHLVPSKCQQVPWASTYELKDRKIEQTMTRHMVPRNAPIWGTRVLRGASND